MAAGVEASLSPPQVEAKLTGWVNVPADCQRPLQKIELHAARPAGVNEPTSDGVLGSQHILELVSSLTDDDLCLVLISVAASALLPAPIVGITFEEKLAVTQFLMRSAATIQELNTVRKRLSRIKGGGLLRTAPAGRMIALIISDVPDDPLDIIASGPTICDTSTPQDAIRVLERFTKRGPVQGDSRFDLAGARPSGEVNRDSLTSCNRLSQSDYWKQSNGTGCCRDPGESDWLRGSFPGNESTRDCC